MPAAEIGKLLRIGQEKSERGFAMKRVIGVFLALCLLMTPLTALAADTPALTVSSGTVKAGEDVTLTVSIQDNPGVAATIIYLYFDTDSFEVDLDSGVKLAGTFKKSGGLLVNSIEMARKNGRYEGAAGENGILALWYSATGTNVNANGALLTVKLHAKKDAANGEHSVRIGYSVNDSCNEKNEKIAFQTGSALVTVSGGSDAKDPKKPVEVPVFTDTSGHWAESFIQKAAELGLVEGYLGQYRPDDTMTRAEFVTILWRASGEPKPAAKASFTDLTQSWYRDAVAWAEETAVVNGVGNGKFDPNGSVTREQLVTILHRLAGTPGGMELMLGGIYDSQYSDSKQVGDWARQALYWSIYEGIFCGENSEKIGNSLAPKAPANRAQIAVMITRYLDKFN